MGNDSQEGEALSRQGSVTRSHAIAKLRRAASQREMRAKPQQQLPEQPTPAFQSQTHPQQLAASFSFQTQAQGQMMGQPLPHTPPHPQIQSPFQPRSFAQEFGMTPSTDFPVGVEPDGFSPRVNDLNGIAAGMLASPGSWQTLPWEASSSSLNLRQNVQSAEIPLALDLSFAMPQPLFPPQTPAATSVPMEPTSSTASTFPLASPAESPSTSFSQLNPPPPPAAESTENLSLSRERSPLARIRERPAARSPLPSLEQLRARILLEREAAGLQRSASTSAASHAARAYALDKLLGNSGTDRFYDHSREGTLIGRGAATPSPTPAHGMGIDSDDEGMESDTLAERSPLRQRAQLRRSRTIGGLSAMAEAQRKAAFVEGVYLAVPGASARSHRLSRARQQIMATNLPPATPALQEDAQATLEVPPASEDVPLGPSPSSAADGSDLDRSLSQRQIARTEMIRKLSTRGRAPPKPRDVSEQPPKEPAPIVSQTFTSGPQIVQTGPPNAMALSDEATPRLGQHPALHPLLTPGGSPAVDEAISPVGVVLRPPSSPAPPFEAPNEDPVWIPRSRSGSDASQGAIHQPPQSSVLPTRHDSSYQRRSTAASLHSGNDAASPTNPSSPVTTHSKLAEKSDSLLIGLGLAKPKSGAEPMAAVSPADYEEQSSPISPTETDALAHAPFEPEREPSFDEKSPPTPVAFLPRANSVKRSGVSAPYAFDPEVLKAIGEGKSLLGLTSRKRAPYDASANAQQIEGSSSEGQPAITFDSERSSLSRTSSLLEEDEDEEVEEVEDEIEEVKFVTGRISPVEFTLQKPSSPLPTVSELKDERPVPAFQTEGPASILKHIEAVPQIAVLPSEPPVKTPSPPKAGQASRVLVDKRIAALGLGAAPGLADRSAGLRPLQRSASSGSAMTSRVHADLEDGRADVESTNPLSTQATGGLAPSTAAMIQRYSRMLTAKGTATPVVPGVSDVAVEDPPRKLLMTDPVFQVISSTTIKDRYLFLFSDVLVIAKPISPPPTGSESAVWTRMKNASMLPDDRWIFSVKNIIDLHRVKVSVTASSRPSFAHSRANNPVLHSFVQHFAYKPDEAVATLVTKMKLPKNPTTLAQLLFQTPELDRAQLTAYITHPSRRDLMQAYISQHRLAGVSIESALRTVLLDLRFPTDVEAFEALLSFFAKRWAISNVTIIKSDFTPELASDLVYAIMALNDALHTTTPTSPVWPSSPDVPHPRNAVTPGFFSAPCHELTKEEFVRVFRDHDEQEVLSDRTLSRIYLSVRAEPIAQALDSHEPRRTIRVRGGMLPTRLVYGQPSEPITLCIDEPDPDLAIRLYGQDSMFDPPILTFGRSRMASFRVTSKSLGAKQIIFVRAGRNARFYAGTDDDDEGDLGTDLPLPRSVTVTVERAFMTHSFTITTGGGGAARKFMLSFENGQKMGAWVDAITSASAQVYERRLQQAGTMHKAADAIALHVLRETLVDSEEAAAGLLNRSATLGAPALDRAQSTSRHYYAASGAGRHERDLGPGGRHTKGASSLSLRADPSAATGSKTLDGQSVITICRQNSLLPFVLDHLQHHEPR